MADYQPLLTRAVANLSTSTAATRLAIYERTRKAQLAHLGTFRPPLPEIDIAREKEALDLAIALIEAKFSGTDSSSADPPFGAIAQTKATPQRSTGSTSTNMARKEASLLPRSSLAKVVRPDRHIQKSNSWPWLALAVVLGAFVALAGAAVVMRQKPQSLAVALPEAQQEPAPQQPAKMAPQAKPSPISTAPVASVAPDMARAAMLIASDDPRNPVVSLGSTVWSTIPPVPGQPATVAVKADADIPDFKMRATMILRKNTDPALQATHTIDLKFSFGAGAPITGVKDVEPKMRNLGSAASETLTADRVKITDTYFLIALVKGDQARNLDLTQTYAWFDFALLLDDNRIAKLVIQKSTKAEAMLAKAFEAWK